MSENQDKPLSEQIKEYLDKLRDTRPTTAQMVLPTWFALWMARQADQQGVAAKIGAAVMEYLEKVEPDCRPWKPVTNLEWVKEELREEEFPSNSASKELLQIIVGIIESASKEHQ